ncbi:unnamed protein product [Nyctereutes procyonoides]|uniref:(raccoon dog) hypothetical protein n=1 Tax=Nyctereutes procyonoides TaxID=34880 RepID=A0A811XVE1_NYCPR|nr:unnamed protein product [Nyctereutes procyonoides]
MENVRPFKADGKVYRSRLLDGLKTFQGGKILENKIEFLLENLNYDLEEKEIQDLCNHLKIDSGKINASDTQLYLENVGIELTRKESQDLLNILPLDDHIKVYKNRLMDGVKTYRGGKVNVNKLDDALENMGFSLEEEEMEELCSHLSIDDEGKIEVSVVMDEGKLFTGGNMGITFTEDKGLKLQNKLPVDAKGKVYVNRLMKELRFLEGVKVSPNKVDIFLKNMGIDLKEKEIKELKDRLPVDGDFYFTIFLKIFLMLFCLKYNGKIDLNVLMDEVKNITGEKVEASDLKNVLGNMGIEITEEEQLMLSKTLPISRDGKVYKKRLLNTVKPLKRTQGS